MVVECKSIKDFHILISPQLQPTDSVMAHHHWIGFETQIAGRLASELDKLGLKKSQCLDMLKKMSEIAYPGGSSRMGELRIEPPEAKLQASAFRETNIGSEKEIDNSVLWRASQSLRSSTSSFIFDRLERDLSWILNSALFKPISNRTTSNTLVQWFTQQSNEISIWHPIVVLDSALWVVKSRTLQPVDWFRLDLIKWNGQREWWCDVVNRSKFNSYITYLTRYYRERFRAIGADIQKM